MQKLRRDANTYDDPWRFFLTKMLRSVSYLQDFPEARLTELVMLLKDEYFVQGRILFKEGEPVKSLLFITEGTVEICINQKNKGRL